MSFAEIHTLHLDFKRRLTSIVGKEVFSEITITPPRGTNDELSFMRLIAWGYVLVFESGRGPLSFLRNLPPLNRPDTPSLKHLNALRTWTSHNLVLGKSRDVTTIRAATMWLLQTCGTGSPDATADWEKCFLALAEDLKSLLRGAIGACDCFEKSVDRSELVEAFNRSLDRNWDAHAFDKYVEIAVEKFGYYGISALDIRRSNLDAWRKIVAASIDDESIKRNLIIRVENDVLSLMASSFPMTSNEVAEKVCVTDNFSITAAMLYLRERSGEKLSNITSVLSELRTLS